MKQTILNKHLFDNCSTAREVSEIYRTDDPIEIYNNKIIKQNNLILMVSILSLFVSIIALLK